VLVCFVVVIYLQVCVDVCCIVHCVQLHCLFICAYHMFLVSACQSADVPV
jgi:hypothetical protein